MSPGPSNKKTGTLLGDLYRILSTNKTKAEFDQEVKYVIVGIGLIGTRLKKNIYFQHDVSRVNSSPHA